MKKKTKKTERRYSDTPLMGAKNCSIISEINKYVLLKVKCRELRYWLVFGPNFFENSPKIRFFFWRNYKKIRPNIKRHQPNYYLNSKNRSFSTVYSVYVLTNDNVNCVRKMGANKISRRVNKVSTVAVSMYNLIVLIVLAWVQKNSIPVIHQSN